MGIAGMALNPNGLGTFSVTNPLANLANQTPNPNMGIMAMMASAVPQPVALAAPPPVPVVQNGQDETKRKTSTSENDSKRKSSTQILVPANLTGGVKQGKGSSSSLNLGSRKHSAASNLNLLHQSSCENDNVSRRHSSCLLSSSPTTTVSVTTMPTTTVTSIVRGSIMSVATANSPEIHSYDNGEKTYL